MQYKLSKVVCSGNYHINIDANIESTIDIIEQTPIYCKLYCQNKMAPLKISLAFKENK